MLYAYWGRDESESQIWQRLKSPRPGVEGEYYISMEDIFQDVKSQGFEFIIGRSYWDFEKAFQPLEMLLKAEIPVMVVQQGSPDPKLGHSRVVIGLDKNYVYVNDPEEKRGGTRISRKKFYVDWERSSDEVTGGVLLAILPKRLKKPVGSLFLDDVTTNTKKVSWVESGGGFEVD